MRSFLPRACLLVGGGGGGGACVCARGISDSTVGSYWYCSFGGGSEDGAGALLPVASGVVRETGGERSVGLA